MSVPLSSATATFGERVRRRRHLLHLSQEAAATRCDVHWTFLGQVERGTRNLSLHNLLKVAAGLGVDPAELVSGLRPPGAVRATGSTKSISRPAVGPEEGSRLVS
jgi:transcriptional regulator with XRE-family HTH domain